MNKERQELNDLIQACLDGRATDEQVALLNARLRSDEAARDLYLQLADTHSCLAVDERLWVDDIVDFNRPDFKVRPSRERWLKWRPLTAAAAGIAFGMFCTSMVFAYISPMLGKVVTLLEDGFESEPAPVAVGVPAEIGRWSGDFAEIVGSQNGVVPHGGAKMWRFLRADNATDAEVQASYVGEAIHVLDLKPLRNAGMKPGSQIEISAWFAMGPMKPDFRYHWNIKAAAFEGSVAEAPKLWGKWDEVSASLARRELAAELGGRWQRLSVTMALPPNADFLVFECAVVQRHPAVTQGVAEFPAHYLDDVRVRLLPPTREASALE